MTHLNSPDQPYPQQHQDNGFGSGQGWDQQPQQQPQFLGQQPPQFNGYVPPQPKQPKFKGWWKGVLIALAIIVGLIVIGSLVGEDTPGTSPQTPVYVPAEAPEEAPAEEPVEEPAPVEDPEPVEEAPEYTTAQQMAIETAESYLDYDAFSKKGLINQLEFEGFDTADAKFAVNHIDVDWMEQAVLAAESYLDYDSFSEQGLVDQLEFEGFTKKQAEHGAATAYANR